MPRSPRQVIDSLPYETISAAIRKSTHGVFDACRRKTAGEQLYGFVWGANDDVTCVDWRANTEERLRASAERWLAQVKRDFPEHEATLEMGFKSQRFDTVCWEVSTDIPVPLDQRDLNPNDTMNAVWDEFQSNVDDDDDDYYDWINDVQKRILDSIVRGLSQFDRECAWPGIDRTRFLLSAFIWDGSPRLNLNAARQLNTPQLFAEFQQGYAPDFDEEEIQGETI